MDTADTIENSDSEYSVWLMPDGELGQTLSSLISRLSREFSAPLFPPHITLIGRLTGTQEELIARSTTLATLLEPYNLALGELDHLDEYFRSLFVRIEETPPVLFANEVARQVFLRMGDPPYMPHLSLLYGDFPPETKESIIKSIGKHLDRHFRASHLYLYSTSGDTQTWRRLGEFPLDKQRD